MFERRRLRIGIGATIAAGAMIAVSVAAPAQAGNGTDTQALRTAVTAAGITEHLAEFQKIATANGGNRAAGLAGHEASAAYVEKAAASPRVTSPSVSISPTTRPSSTPPCSLRSPRRPRPTCTTSTYTEMSYASEGNVTAAVTAVDVNITGDRASTSGCEDADFAAFPAGNIALIQRGTCSFREKADNALRSQSEPP